MGMFFRVTFEDNSDKMELRVLSEEEYTQNYRKKKSDLTPTDTIFASYLCNNDSFQLVEDGYFFQPTTWHSERLILRDITGCFHHHDDLVSNGKLVSPLSRGRNAPSKSLVGPSACEAVDAGCMVDLCEERRQRFEFATTLYFYVFTNGRPIRYICVNGLIDRSVRITSEPLSQRKGMFLVRLRTTLGSYWSKGDIREVVAYQCPFQSVQHAVKSSFFTTRFSSSDKESIPVECDIDFSNSSHVRKTFCVTVQKDVHYFPDVPPHFKAPASYSFKAYVGEMVDMQLCPFSCPFRTIYTEEGPNIANPNDFQIVSMRHRNPRLCKGYSLRQKTDLKLTWTGEPLSAEECGSFSDKSTKHYSSVRLEECKGTCIDVVQFLSDWIIKSSKIPSADNPSATLGKVDIMNAVDILTSSQVSEDNISYMRSLAEKALSVSQEFNNKISTKGVPCLFAEAHDFFCVEDVIPNVSIFVEGVSDTEFVKGDYYVDSMKGFFRVVPHIRRDMASFSPIIRKRIWGQVWHDVTSGNYEALKRFSKGRSGMCSPSFEARRKISQSIHSVQFTTTASFFVSPGVDIDPLTIDPLTILEVNGRLLSPVLIELSNMDRNGYIVSSGLVKEIMANSKIEGNDFVLEESKQVRFMRQGWGMLLISDTDSVAYYLSSQFDSIHLSDGMCSEAVKALVDEINDIDFDDKPVSRVHSFSAFDKADIAKMKAYGLCVNGKTYEFVDTNEETVTFLPISRTFSLPKRSMDTDYISLTDPDFFWYLEDVPECLGSALTISKLHHGSESVLFSTLCSLELSTHRKDVMFPDSDMFSTSSEWDNGVNSLQLLTKCPSSALFVSEHGIESSLCNHRLLHHQSSIAVNSIKTSDTVFGSVFPLLVKAKASHVNIGHDDAFFYEKRWI